MIEVEDGYRPTVSTPRLQGAADVPSNGGSAECTILFTSWARTACTANRLLPNDRASRSKQFND